MKTFVKILILLVLLVIVVFEIIGTALPCDTWVALAGASARGVTILAKNSDRPLFDSQPLMLHPRAEWPAGSTIDLGRIRIPQVGETYATLGSSPYWCWGYEEGINEFGVAIGNEGVSTKPLLENMKAAAAGRAVPYGPTGMDLLRLGLERGRTAKEALDVITGLVEKYGQFGSGIPTAGIEGAYDNSYLIADPREAWVLETAGRHWAARKFEDGTASISNALSLSTEFDLASNDLAAFAVEKGWWPKNGSAPLDFTSAYIDDSVANKDRIANALARRTCSAGLLRDMGNKVTVASMMRIARDRSSSPSLDLDQTASSCVAALPAGPDNLPVLWWCASTPSRGCYMPFFVHGSRIPVELSAAGTAGRRVVAPERAARDAFSENSFWWLFRDLCDKINADEAGRLPKARAVFDALERDFADQVPAVVAEAAALRKAGKPAEAARLLDSFSEGCAARALTAVRDLRVEFSGDPSIPIPPQFAPYVGTYKAASGPLRGREYRILVRNGKLALDIPGQTVAELKDPDHEGIRYLVVSGDVGVSFEAAVDEKTPAMRIHQTTVLSRDPTGEGESDTEAPTDVAPYLGKYRLAGAGIEITVRAVEGRLVLDIPGQRAVGLGPPDGAGRYAFGDDPGALASFVRGPEGRATALRIHQTFSIPRKT